MSYDNTNTGVLFKNDKDGNEKRPDYKGKLDVEGKEYEIAGWVRQSKKGTSFMSLSIQEPRQRHSQESKEPEAPRDEIPF